MRERGGERERVSKRERVSVREMVTSERSNLLSERERAIKVQTKSNVFEMMGAQSEQRRLTRSIALN